MCMCVRNADSLFGENVRKMVREDSISQISAGNDEHNREAELVDIELRSAPILHMKDWFHGSLK